jgi:CRISPR-associated protein (TIGR02584 family)
MQQYTQTLLATLGGQPQVVTLTLDLLLRHDFTISEVFVIHPKADARLQRSLARLQAEFSGNRYQIDGRTINCRFSSRVLRLNNDPLEDITDSVSAAAVHETINNLIRELKHERKCIVHLSVTGGRRMMGLLAMAAAQVNFKHLDHIWHIYAPDEFKRCANEGAIMHASEQDGVHLLAVPFVPWGDYFPHLPQSPSTIMHIDPQESARCARVELALNENQRKTLRAFARGLDRNQVAQELSISLKTVDAHKTIIFDKCRQEWGDLSGQSITYHFLREKFAMYFTHDQYTSIL